MRGHAGMILPFVGISRRWSDSTMALVVVSVLVADGFTLWLLWTRA
ncbi:hypothetical protein [Nocardioides sp. B-3]|nr:hypothetical protein [Nocardioides sp. B-3]UUZ59984.1 hypothetical protein LP418_02900 [Nocardioides sp. B-3]